MKTFISFLTHIFERLWYAQNAGKGEMDQVVISISSLLSTKKIGKIFLKKLLVYCNKEHVFSIPKI